MTAVARSVADPRGALHTCAALIGRCRLWWAAARVSRRRFSN